MCGRWSRVMCTYLWYFGLSTHLPSYSTDSIWLISLLLLLPLAGFCLSLLIAEVKLEVIGCSVDGLGAVWTIFGRMVMGWSSSARSSDGSSSIGVSTSTWTGASSCLRNLWESKQNKPLKITSSYLNYSSGSKGRITQMTQNNTYLLVAGAAKLKIADSPNRPPATKNGIE